MLIALMPLQILRRLVLVVVHYAAAVTLGAALLGRREHEVEAPTAAVAIP